MYDMAILGAWLEFAVRWVHVITAIAWIGSSFYFIALDLAGDGGAVFALRLAVDRAAVWGECGGVCGQGAVCRGRGV